MSEVLLAPRSWQILLVAAVSAALWSVAVWFWTGRSAEERLSRLIDRELEVAERSASGISVNIGRHLAHLRSIPAVLAKEPSLIAQLSKFGPDAQPSPLPMAERRQRWLDDPDLNAIAHRLADTVGDVGANQLWVVNAAGDCITSGGFSTEATATGQSYLDREYYLAGRRGMNGRQFAVGRTTDIPGLYYSSPVAPDGQFLGVVVVKMDLNNLDQLVTDPNAFVTDENGVIILSGNRRLLMLSLPGAPINDLPALDRQNRYKRTDFPTIALVPAPTAAPAPLVHWADGTMRIAVAKAIDDEILTVHVLAPLTDFGAIKDERLLLFALLSATGSLLIFLVGGALVYLRNNHAHRHEMALANAELAGLAGKLARQANTDVLTGCANRRHFMDALVTERQRCSRYSGTFSVMILDLDLFKEINDRFGHPAGDKALCHLVDVIGNNLRSPDLLGRLGGDEFAILMPQTDAARANILGDRIRKAIEAQDLELGDERATLGISFGVAEWRADENEDIESLQMRADRALYAHKNQRKGQQLAQVASD